MRKIYLYLNNDLNHTGYSQVLEEKVTIDGVTTVTTYTIGHDVLAQANATNGILTLLHDGHGSTRAVADMLAAIQQQYSYDAYGNAISFDPSVALTNLLYSGEQFNPVSGLQYLRARWYNPQTGTFNRLDPYSGKKTDPQSFHKYAYANMNPIRNVDPSGNSAILLWVMAAMLQATFVALNTANAFYHIRLAIDYRALMREAIERKDDREAAGCMFLAAVNTGLAVWSAYGAVYTIMAPPNIVLSGPAFGAFSVATAGVGRSALAVAGTYPIATACINTVIKPIIADIMYRRWDEGRGNGGGKGGGSNNGYEGEKPRTIKVNSNTLSEGDAQRLNDAWGTNYSKDQISAAIHKLKRQRGLGGADNIEFGPDMSIWNAQRGFVELRDFYM